MLWDPCFLQGVKESFSGFGHKIPPQFHILGSMLFARCQGILFWIWTQNPTTISYFGIHAFCKVSRNPFLDLDTKSHHNFIFWDPCFLQGVKESYSGFGHKIPPQFHILGSMLFARCQGILFWIWTQNPTTISYFGIHAFCKVSRNPFLDLDTKSHHNFIFWDPCFLQGVKESFSGFGHKIPPQFHILGSMLFARCQGILFWIWTQNPTTISYFGIHAFCKVSRNPILDLDTKSHHNFIFWDPCFLQGVKESLSGFRQKNPTTISYFGIHAFCKVSRNPFLDLDTKSHHNFIFWDPCFLQGVKESYSGFGHKIPPQFHILGSMLFARCQGILFWIWTQNPTTISYFGIHAFCKVSRNPFLDLDTKSHHNFIFWDPCFLQGVKESFSGFGHKIPPQFHILGSMLFARCQGILFWIWTQNPTTISYFGIHAFCKVSRNPFLDLDTKSHHNFIFWDPCFLQGVKDSFSGFGHKIPPQFHILGSMLFARCQGILFWIWTQNPTTISYFGIHAFCKVSRNPFLDLDKKSHHNFIFWDPCFLQGVKESLSGFRQKIPPQFHILGSMLFARCQGILFWIWTQNPTTISYFGIHAFCKVSRNPFLDLDTKSHHNFIFWDPCFLQGVKESFSGFGHKIPPQFHILGSMLFARCQGILFWIWTQNPTTISYFGIHAFCKVSRNPFLDLDTKSHHNFIFWDPCFLQGVKESFFGFGHKIPPQFHILGSMLFARCQGILFWIWTQNPTTISYFGIHAFCKVSRNPFLDLDTKSHHNFIFWDPCFLQGVKESLSGFGHKIPPQFHILMLC